MRQDLSAPGPELVLGARVTAQTVLLRPFLTGADSDTFFSVGIYLKMAPLNKRPVLKLRFQTKKSKPSIWPDSKPIFKTNLIAT